MNGSLFKHILAGALLLSACNRSSKHENSDLDAIHNDVKNSIMKIPTPEHLQEVPGAPLYIPLVRTHNYQVDPATEIGYTLMCTDPTEMSAILQPTTSYDATIFSLIGPAYEDPAEPTDEALALDFLRQPTLYCPSDQVSAAEKPTLFASLSSPPTYYIAYRNSPVASQQYLFLEVGCSELLDALNLNTDDATKTDIAALIDLIPGAAILDLNCKQGSPWEFSPFVQQCEEAVDAGFYSSDPTTLDAYVVYRELLERRAMSTCGDLWNDIKSVTELDMTSWDIASVEPLQYLPNLQTLSLSDNFIEDITSLRYLSGIRELDLSKNYYLTDINVLSQMSSLRSLNLLGTQVSNLMPLRELTKIYELSIDEEQIDPMYCPADAFSDAVAALCQGSSPFVLACDEASTTSNSQTEFFSKLKTQLNQTTCEDLEAVVNSSNSLNMSGTQLTSIDGIQHIPHLTAINLSANVITDLSPLSQFQQLLSLDLSDNLITDPSPLQNLNSLSLLNISMNKISDLRSLASLTVFSGDVEVADNPVKFVPTFLDWCRLSINQGISYTLTVLKTELGETICDAESDTVLSLTKLNLENKGLIDASPIGSFSSLTELNLRSNQLTDVVGLTLLNQLSFIDISRNQISSLAPLTALSGLTNVQAASNLLLDINDLASLINLKKLNLRYNSIDLASYPLVAGYIALNYLDLSFNPDLSATISLNSMTNLKQLYLRSVGVSDFSSLEALTGLEALDLSKNTISETSFLGSLSSLKRLLMEDSDLVQISILSLLEQLEIIDLSGNRITNQTSLSNSLGLMFVDLRGNSDLEPDCPVSADRCLY